MSDGRSCARGRKQNAGTGCLILTAALHDSQGPLDHVRSEHLLAGHGAHAAIGEGAGHRRHDLAGRLRTCQNTCFRTDASLTEMYGLAAIDLGTATSVECDRSGVIQQHMKVQAHQGTDVSVFLQRSCHVQLAWMEQQDR